ncbi:MAG: aspartate-alanine antiporter, partial [Muribaculaceae bacterium]|nr:aspartate-alanine antiporter [Muribaculaceae bacterium]
MWFIEALRHTPALAVFLTIGIGFWLGKLKFKGIALGTVTAVLIVGVLVGQLDINVGGPLKSVSFLLFLFCIGYSVGPQFFKSLKGDGLKEVMFALVVCVLILGAALGVSYWFGLNPGQAAGMMAGASTASPVVGAAEDTINSLSGDPDKIKAMVAAIPVCYAMTYVFGTLGAVWLLGYVGPAMMGGLDKVKAMTRELEKTLSPVDAGSDPASFNACRPIAFRAFEAVGPWMDTPRKVSELEQEFESKRKRITVERIKRNGNGDIIDNITPDTEIYKGDIVALAGRREMIVGQHEWFGYETAGVDILSFPVEDVDVTVMKKFQEITVHELMEKQFMEGVDIKKITRNDVALNPLGGTTVKPGDIVELVGSKKYLNRAAKEIGYADPRTLSTDFVFIGIGILLGGLLGALAIKIGAVSVSLGASGGALVAGLIMGWLRAKRPVYGAIPKASLWVFNNLGLNMYIAVIGIASGPSFISAFSEVGPKIFVAGLIVTLVPLFLAILIGHKLFKFHPAVTLGCCAGARKTTAGLGAVQERLGSSVPALGYTITYAVSNTVLIIFGIVLVLL